MITDNRIDFGKPFDWGRTSENYAKFRDIYPREFYGRIAARGLCIKGQRVLDIGTGTGVLPRNMYEYGAEWTGTDISEKQIAQAKRLAAESGMNISFKAVSAEQLDYPAQSFDVITACQCFWYFNHEITAPLFAKILKPDGRLLFLAMEWLPFEDAIASASEQLVLKYNPRWTGAGEMRHEIEIPEAVSENFELVHSEVYDISVPFTRETWHGRMLACRGVGASLNETEISQWDTEHRALLERIAPESFEILHYAALAELKPKKEII
ncbi:MAG: class I SAM-dependent methyltransferase [Oscillospiraceae bacterium]